MFVYFWLHWVLVAAVDSLASKQGLLIAVASLAAEQGALLGGLSGSGSPGSRAGFSGCGPWA